MTFWRRRNALSALDADAESLKRGPNKNRRNKLDITTVIRLPHELTTNIASVLLLTKKGEHSPSFYMTLDDDDWHWMNWTFPKEC